MSPKLTKTAPLFAALADETRLGIVARLCERGPSSIARLTDGTSVSRQAITKHLHALSRAGVVRSTRAGRERIWTLETKRLAEARLQLERIARQWDAALLRLKALVEEDG